MATNEKKTTTLTVARRQKKSTAPALLLAIVDKGKSVKVNELYERNGVFFTMVTRGRGTASSEILDVLGLEESEKDVLISIADQSVAKSVMDIFNDSLSGFSCGKGIACRLKLNSAPNLLVQMLGLTAKRTEENKVENKDKYSLIVISVEQGYADEVMSVAKKAGARGGTIMRAHQMDNEHTEGLFAKDFTPEREILLILAHADRRNAILESVNSQHGIRKEANAVVVSLGVEEIAKLS